MDSAPPSLRTRLGFGGGGSTPGGGGPLLFGVDPRGALDAAIEGSARPHEWADEGGSLGVLARSQPSAVLRFHEEEVAAGADVLLALTGETTSRALHDHGMAFRSAAITAAAIDLAHQAADGAGRGVIVGAVLGGGWTARLAEDRLVEETRAHALRLSAAGAAIVVARGARGGSELTRAAVLEAACSTGLPTYALLEVDGDVGDDTEGWARRSTDAGASGLLFVVSRADAGCRALDAARRAAPDVRVGFFLSAVEAEVRGWVAEALALLGAGAWSIGGAEGTTPRHLEALAIELGRNTMARQAGASVPPGRTRVG